MNERVSMQQDARIALMQIARDLRMAGSYGCATLDATNTAASAVVTVDTSGVASAAVYQTLLSPASGTYVPFQSYADSSGGAWLGDQTASSGTDVLAVQYGRGTAQANSVVASTGVATFSAPANRQRSYTVGQHYWVASTCQRIQLKSSAGLASSGVTASLGVDTSGADIMDFVSRAYFVNASNALVMTELGQSGSLVGPSELISRVTGFTVEYGEIKDADRAGCLVTYRKRSSVSNWRNVSTVRITLSVQSRNQVPLASTGVNGFLTQTYQTTAAIRGKQCYKSS
ncbi:PilW family protein [Paludibacterium denitrificans]|uniref:Uncharacterized protein n=1 Tax=Paludibacterium denitrificans TaxID=2675226 RepID=A0A844GD02_9NEIS|nr:PilW family protein [Paludibacterium denitrificans]MTD33161.1 hypothetical protein [Paludibacterium denitrificans]